MKQASMQTMGFVWWRDHFSGPVLVLSVSYWTFFHCKGSWCKENTVREHYVEWQSQWCRVMATSKRDWRLEESYSHLFSVHTLSSVICFWQSPKKPIFNKVPWETAMKNTNVFHIHLPLMRGTRAALQDLLKPFVRPETYRDKCNHFSPP